MGLHTGACHCGKVAYEVEVELDGLIECNCSHCYAKGLVLAFAPRSRFRWTAGEDETASYFFNQHGIDHRFCRTCGVEPVGFGQGPDGTETVAINVRTLKGREPWDWSAQRFDGRRL